MYILEPPHPPSTSAHVPTRISRKRYAALQTLSPNLFVTSDHAPCSPGALQQLPLVSCYKLLRLVSLFFLLAIVVSTLSCFNLMQLN